MWKQLAEWDSDLFVYLNNLGIDDYDSFWIWITQITHWIPLYILFVLLFFSAFHWHRALMVAFFTLLTAAATLFLTGIVKTHVGRLRPNNQPLLDKLIRVLQEPHNFSFFSGHAATSFAVTTFVVLCLRRTYKWIYIFYIWPILFASSRIFVGVHYPGDILVGAGVGVLMALLFYQFYKKALIKLEYS
ncbi:MAG: phosphatase PAP2 family protein [Leeuwenhoekiella sp.]